MQVDDLTGDRQAQSGTAFVLLMRLVHFVKTLPDIGEVFRRNSDAGVLHRTTQGAGFCLRQRQGHAAAGRRIFHGVVGQYQQQLHQPVAVAQNLWQSFARFDPQRDLFGLGQRLHQLPDMAKNFGQILRLKATARFGGLQLAQFQQSFDQALQSNRFIADHLQETVDLFAVIDRAVQYGFGIAANDRQWRAQLVRNVGDEIAAQFFGLGRFQHELAEVSSQLVDRGSQPADLIGAVDLHPRAVFALGDCAGGILHRP